MDELVKRVNILMKHELKNAVVYLNVKMQVDPELTIKGEINGLVQIINNMISNSIQAYNGKTEQNIDMIINKDKDNLVISIRDYAGGLPQKVKEKLFKEMITTKGKNGTGLGLYISYSNIKAYFGGTIKYESVDGQGTTFKIILPNKK
jgi:C4-dicarboxylate-specific signal transduction histidine kinase